MESCLKTHVGTMTLFTGDIQNLKHMFPGVEDKSFISVSIKKTKASLMPLIALGSRLGAVPGQV